jgi:hypothetical protein
MAMLMLDQFDDFLRRVWKDNTEAEAMLLWRRSVENTPDVAEADLEALDAVVADPPPDLPRRLAEHGWIHLVHQPGVVPYSLDETVEWLRETTAKLRATATPS